MNTASRQYLTPLRSQSATQFRQGFPQLPGARKNFCLPKNHCKDSRTARSLCKAVVIHLSFATHFPKHPGELAMRVFSRIPLFASIVLASSLALVAAEGGDSPSPLPRTVAVAAFKNGLAFVLRQGEVPLTSGEGRIAPIPEATLGSLWLSPESPGSKLDELVAYRYNVASRQPIPSIGAILQANPGKTVTITYQSKDYTGELVGVRDSAPASNQAAPASLPREDYVLLRMDKRLLAIPVGGISMAAFPEDAVLHETTERPDQALRFTVTGGMPKEKLTMGYLEHGIGWTPSYLVSLADDKTARISMQSVVTDDAEDIRDADLYFVVGVPNFAYANTLSPMSLQQSLLDFMQSAELDRRGLAGVSNALNGQMIAYENVSLKAAPASLTPLVSDLSGAPEEDLFLYHRSHVTLGKGERATYNVFSGSVACQHLYSWEVKDPPRVDAYGNVINNNAYSPDANQVDSVWHTIRLKNSTAFPWTSAPALVVSGDKPISQDTLAYTPKGASSVLRITVATDIRASHEEREVARQRDLSHRRGYSYDLVTVEGRLTVRNYKSGDVKLSIGENLRGKVEYQSDQGKTVELAEGIESDNPNSRLSWEFTLKPGEQRVVTYRYNIWVRA
jgi:hypothetical protein